MFVCSQFKEGATNVTDEYFIRDSVVCDNN